MGSLQSGRRERRPGKERKKKRPLSAGAAYRYISNASILTMALAARSIATERREQDEPIDHPIDFLSRIEGESDEAVKLIAIQEYLERLRWHGEPYTEGDSVFFLYHGKARRVSVPSDLNGWTDASDTMKRIRGTNLFILKKKVDESARFEYKFAVDSNWILDPLNRQQALGGYGPNSEIRMPRYATPREIEYRSGIAHGTVDAFRTKSRILKRSHPVFVYTPPGYQQSRRSYPTIYVTDGGEYISLALMLNVLDNLIAEDRIQPIITVFIDPRTDVTDGRTSKRMTDYMMSDAFLSFLVGEVRPRILKRYSSDARPEHTAILGASLGGLMATYASFTRPDVFGLCAAQSPAYWVKDRAIIKMFSEEERKPIRLYIDTGTIRDAQADARRMKIVLERKGYLLHYAEYPEGHNWMNWRARIADVLEYFFGIDKARV